MHKEITQEAAVLRESLFERCLSFSIDKVLLPVSGFAILCAMMVVVAEVIGRSFFNHPIFGAAEIISQLMVLFICFCLAYAEKLDLHLRIDFVRSKLSMKAVNFLDLFVYIIAVVALCFVIWANGDTAIISIQSKEGEILAPEMMPLYPTRIILVIGFILLALRFIVRAIDALRKILTAGR